MSVFNVLKRRKRLICLGTVFGLLLAGAVVVWIRAYIPRLAERVAPVLASHFGIDNLSVGVERLSRQKIVLKNLRAGAGDYRGLDIGEIRIVRAAAAPLQIKIDNATLQLMSVNGEWLIPGLQRSSRIPDMASEPRPLVETLRLPAALLKFIQPGVSVSIENFTLQLTRHTQAGHVSVSLPMNLAAELDTNGHLTLSVHGMVDDIQNLPFLPPGISCSKADLQLTASGDFYTDKACENAAVNAQLNLSHVQYKTESVTNTIPALSLTAEINQVDAEFQGVLTTEFAKGALQMPFFSVSSLSGRIPIAFRYTDSLLIEPPAGPKHGKIDFARLVIGNGHIMAGEFQYVQKGRDLLLTGNLNPASRAEATNNAPVLLTAHASLSPASGPDQPTTCGVSARWTPVSFHLGNIHPSLDITILDGVVQAEAKAVLERGQLLTSASASIADASLEQKEKRLSITGLDVTMSMPDLRQFRTSPNQNLSFQTLALGDLAFENGLVAWQLEAPGKLLLERLSTQWCQGHMAGNALRIDFDKPKDLDLTLFCNNIDVAELLSQLNVASASGQARVAGRIPLKYTNGKLNIDHGFLHSVPGKEGHLSVSSLADTGLGGNLQMAIAREALKDYTYKWLRLAFNTVEKTLFVRLEMDGMPAGKLPFSYDETTVLKQSPEDESGATFQGISFDINFSIPIDDVLYYGSKTGNLFKK